MLRNTALVIAFSTFGLSSSADAGQSFVQQCTSLLYSAGRVISKSDICSTNKSEILSIRREFDEKCTGMFTKQQQDNILRQALIDARGSYKKEGQIGFCSH